MTSPTNGRVTSFIAGGAAVLLGAFLAPRALNATHDFIADALADGFGRAEQNAIEDGLEAMAEAANSLQGGAGPSVLNAAGFAARVEGAAE